MSDKDNNSNHYTQLSAQTSTRNISSFSESEYLLELGANGHYPLFYPKWIMGTINRDKKPVSLSIARKEVKKTLDGLSCHKNYERKKMALGCMDEEKRDKFVKSFLRVVENKILDRQLTSLQ